jgi:hypothetical protein
MGWCLLLQHWLCENTTIEKMKALLEMPVINYLYDPCGNQCSEVGREVGYELEPRYGQDLFFTSPRLAYGQNNLLA